MNLVVNNSKRVVTGNFSQFGFGHAAPLFPLLECELWSINIDKEYIHQNFNGILIPLASLRKLLLNKPLYC